MVKLSRLWTFKKVRHRTIKNRNKNVLLFKCSNVSIQFVLFRGYEEIFRMCPLKGQDIVKWGNIRIVHNSIQSLLARDFNFLSYVLNFFVLFSWLTVTYSMKLKHRKEFLKKDFNKFINCFVLPIFSHIPVNISTSSGDVVKANPSSQHHQWQEQKQISRPQPVLLKYNKSGN